MKSRLAFRALIPIALLFITLLMVQASTDAAPAAVQMVGVRLEPDDPLPADALRVVDYGSFRWVLLPAGAANGVELQSSADAAAAPRSNDRDLQLVQLIGPTKQKWLDALETNGIEVVQYLAPFTYVVFARPSQVDRLQQRTDFIHWHGAFDSGQRLRQPTAIDGDGAAALRYSVVVYAKADLPRIAAAFAAVGAPPPSFTPLTPKLAIGEATLTPAQATAAAAIPGLYTLQPASLQPASRDEWSAQVVANRIGAGETVTPGYLAWLQAVGVDGDGVNVAVVDEGVDNNHPDLNSRMQPCSGSSCGGGVSSFHGTHVAGIVAGDASTGTLSNGFLRGLGVAPAAGVIEQLYSPTYNSLPNGLGMLKLMQQSVQNGAQISTNSWGPAATPQGYDINTMQVDVGVRDADPDSSGNQPLVYILAIMNGYGGVSSQGTPDEAKNLIAVGSTKMRTSGGDQDSSLADLSSNSAHGPALDGRILPQIVAPGCRVESTTPGSNYSLLCGTSMAAPQVAGGAALFFDYYRQLTGDDPSPALVKAALTAAAVNLAGNNDADGGTLAQPFSSRQGWGRLDISAVISPTAPVLYFDQATLFSETGEQWQQTLQPADPAQPVRIMLVWTDAPGHGLGGTQAAWVNDLDLRVDANGETYLGNRFDNDGWSTTGGTADGRNNSEAVFLQNGGSAFDLKVTAANVAGDAIPGNGSALDQDFAIACYNCKLLMPTVSPTMTLTKSVSVSEARMWQTVTFTVEQHLLAPQAPETFSTITDTVPAGLQLIAASVTLNGVQRADLANGATLRLHTDQPVLLVYQAIVMEAAPAGVLHINTVTASAPTDPPLLLHDSAGVTGINFVQYLPNISKP